jgi:two-component system, OmpR family, KDP operon response regulator KdpE
MTQETSLPIVLIVDDSPTNRKNLNDLLIDMSLYPVPVSDERAARHRLDGQNRPALVLLDLNLSQRGNEGLAFLRFIKGGDEFREIPVIVVSVNAEKSKIVECLKAGADDYLINPYAPEELEARVRNALERAENLRARREGRREPPGS